MKYVQIDNEVIISEFSCAQDEQLWPGTLMVEDNDERYIAYVGKLFSVGNLAMQIPAVLERNQ